MRRDGNTDDIATWSVGQSAARAVRDGEVPHERRVSQHIGRMTVLWVAVPDEPGPSSARAHIERNAIALLSNALGPADPPGEQWLGLHNARAEIRESGLWNLNYVRDVPDLRFLMDFEDHVVAMGSAGLTRSSPAYKAGGAP
jgi:hypothetical protein